MEQHPVRITAGERNDICHRQQCQGVRIREGQAAHSGGHKKLSCKIRINA